METMTTEERVEKMREELNKFAQDTIDLLASIVELRNIGDRIDALEKSGLIERVEDLEDEVKAIKRSI